MVKSWNLLFVCLIYPFRIYIVLDDLYKPSIDYTLLYLNFKYGFKVNYEMDYGKEKRRKRRIRRRRITITKKLHVEKKGEEIGHLPINQH